ncbi:hypothetical protein VNO77_49018 [Canavalia gladiata]|uniref:Uncharacterized protein n=1 Tax=Canavalia gladiata TaxID=3824 RepID=A0AAN9JDL0_CANGL
MCKCRSHGTFPLFGLQSSHLNICYYHQDLHRRPLRPGSRLGFCSDRRALLLIEAWSLPRRPDERFARQYRCGPPPEFPLASPRSGIVHHLSGPDRYALTRTLHRRSGSVGGATHKGIPPISFLTPYGFTHPLTRTHVRLLGPCFKTGRMGNPQVDARSMQVPKHVESTHAAIHNRDDDVSTRISTSQAWATIAIRIDQCPESIGGPAHTPWTEFTARLGLHSQTTRLADSASWCDRVRARRGSHPLWRPAPPSRGLGPGPPLRTLLQTTIRTPKVTDFHGGLFPVRSPLLRESLKLKGSRSKCERKPCMIGLEDHSTTIYHGAFHQGLIFQPTTRQCLWEANLHPTKYLIGKGIGVGGTLCDTQAGVPST